VSTAKLIKALETALAKREKEISEYETAHKKYVKEKEEFVKNLPKLIGTNKVTLKDTNLNERAWKSELPEVMFTFSLSASIKIPQSPESVSYQVRNECEEIRNAIAILKMTDDETVSTNSYKGVAQYV
jgi:hypothetical protein